MWVAYIIYYKVTFWGGGGNGYFNLLFHTHEQLSTWTFLVDSVTSLFVNWPQYSESFLRLSDSDPEHVIKNLSDQENH